MTTTLTGLSALIAGTRAAVEKDPKNAALLVQAEATSHDAVASTVKLGKYSVVVDEPAALGGGNTAPNPVEYYLTSLLSCHVVTYRVWAAQLGIALDDVSASAEGDLDIRGFFGFDDSVRSGFQEVRVTVKLTGPESRERYLELHEKVEQHCPVLDLTRNQTPVTTVLSEDSGQA